MDFSSLFSILALAVKYGPQIANLIKAGTPVAQAVTAHAPELWTAIKGFIPESVRTGDIEADAATVAKAIFTPHMTTEQERAWMDRASKTFDGA